MATPSVNETASKLLAALYPVKIIDEAAETAEEIAAKIGKSYSHTRKLVLDQVKSGALEEVWKQGRIRPTGLRRSERRLNSPSKPFAKEKRETTKENPPS